MGENDETRVATSSKPRLIVNPPRPIRTLESRIEEKLSKSFKIAPKTEAELAENHTQRDIDSLDDTIEWTDFLSSEPDNVQKDPEKIVHKKSSRSGKKLTNNSVDSAKNNRKRKDGGEKTKNRKKKKSPPIPITVDKKRKISVPKHFQERLNLLDIIQKRCNGCYQCW